MTSIRSPAEHRPERVVELELGNARHLRAGVVERHVAKNEAPEDRAFDRSDGHLAAQRPVQVRHRVLAEHRSKAVGPCEGGQAGRRDGDERGERERRPAEHPPEPPHRSEELADAEHDLPAPVAVGGAQRKTDVDGPTGER